jgi:hypothetical protein
MKKIFLTIILLIAFTTFSGLAHAAKQIELTTTDIIDFRVTVNDDGSATCLITVVILDDVGDEVKHVTKVIPFVDLAVQVRANINNVLRLLSQTINNEEANNNTITWTDR